MPLPKPVALTLFLVLVVALPALAAGQVVSEPSRAEATDTVPLFRLERLTVEGRIDDLVGTATSASEGYVGARDLSSRPISREGELLETVPGVILTQHSGSGKSNQMFVRGFNLDHGTDFSTRVEGMPVNVVSHAHGQGYTDLNFLVPELVDHVEYSLGTHHADIGDFGSAGGARVRLIRSLGGPLFVGGFGTDGHRRLVAAVPASLGGRDQLVLAAARRAYDGPWTIPEQVDKVSAMARYTWEGEVHDVSVLALGYDNSWAASDQIPARAVEVGTLDRWGQVDPTLGGTTSRYSLSARWNRSTRASSQRLEAFAVRYDLDLYSNFTYFLDDPTAGDQIRQTDDGRWMVGAALTDRRKLAGLEGRHEMATGLEVRRDRADVSLGRTRERVLVDLVRRDRIRQWGGGLYANVESRWTSRLRTMMGLRADLHGFDVVSDRQANSGSRRAGIVSPKLSVAFEARPATELYLNGGLGYHSNDARGTVQRVDPVTGDAVAPVTPLVRSRGGELGLRTAPLDGLRSAVTVWAVDLDSELLFVGDAGTTEPSDPSRRVGVTVANFYRLGSGWTFDLDLSVSRARFRDVPDGMNRIPGALENVVAGGIAYAPVEEGPFGALRLRRFGSYPLVEDDTRRARANDLWNLSLGYRIGGIRVGLSVLNLFDERHSDIQYFYRSRLQGEPAAGVADLHFHPAEPRQLRIELRWGG